MQKVSLTLRQLWQVKNIRSKNRSKKYKQHLVWGKTKRICTKWKNHILFQPFIVEKHFKIGQRKIKFPQRKIARRSFVLKETLRLNFLLSPYNLVVNIKGHEAYLQVKEALEFSQLGLLNFEFWHLSKTWIKYIFTKNLQNVNLQKFLNGSVLVIKTQTINDLLETLVLFSNYLEQVTPVGVFFTKRFLWISHSLELFSNFFDTVEDLQVKILQKSNLLVSLFPSLFQFLNLLLVKTLTLVLNFPIIKNNKN